MKDPNQVQRVQRVNRVSRVSFPAEKQEPTELLYAVESKQALGACLNSLEGFEKTAMLQTYNKHYLLQQSPDRIDDICERPLVSVDNYIELYDDYLLMNRSLGYQKRHAEFMRVVENSPRRMGFYEDKYGSFEDILDLMMGEDEVSDEANNRRLNAEYHHGDDEAEELVAEGDADEADEIVAEDDGEIQKLLKKVTKKPRQGPADTAPRKPVKPANNQ